MSVYKPTYCHPYLTAVDVRKNIIQDVLSGNGYASLSCKVDSSNKPIFGYQVILLDSDNNQIFPVKGKEKISPISDALVVAGDLSTSGSISEGALNGDTIIIPFFQRKEHTNERVASYNALYLDLDRTSATTTSFECYYYVGSVFANEPISYFTTGETYKWQVILYQGNYIDSTDTTKNTLKDAAGHSVDADNVARPYYMDYSTLPESNFDMVLTNGKVLGSTNKRIQMANTTGLAANGVTEIEQKIPESSVVILGRYLQLYTTDKTTGERSQAGSLRGYVESYDSSYGHAYTTADWASRNSQTVIDASDSVAFFKYSNDPTYVKASEEVDVASMSPVDEKTLQSGGSITWSSTGNNSTDQTAGYPITEGTTVLLMGQENAQENGVYVAHTNAAWTRSASYDTWAELIGKVIFVQYGTFGGKNYESQAYAGGSLLDSFTKLYTLDHSFTYVCGAIDPGSVDNLKTYLTANIPSYSPSVGDYILFTGVVTSATNSWENTYAQYYYASNSSGTTNSWERSTLKLYTSSSEPSRFKATQGVLGSNMGEGVGVYVPLILSSPLPTTVGSIATVSNVLKSTEANYSYVRFSEEEPIVLFPSALTQTVAAVYTGKNEKLVSGQPLTTEDLTTAFDGFPLTSLVAQDYILNPYQLDSTIGDSGCQLLQLTVTPKATDTALTFTLVDDVITTDSVIYVQRGKIFGLKTWKNIGWAFDKDLPSGTRDYTTTSAKILKNDATHTYVTPFTGLIAGMHLSFSSSEVANKFRPFIEVKGINTSVWKISHDSIATAYKEGALTYPSGLRSSPMVGDKLYDYTPFKYAVTSFFQASDENPYWSYTYPTLEVLDMNTSDLDSESHPVWDGSGTKIVHSRKLYILANYEQGQKASWESYRWWLTDDTGEVLQDTGLKYDQKIATTFFGLYSSASGAVDADKIYYTVHLTVTDSIGNSMSWSQKFYSEEAGNPTKSVPFTASLNTQLQCIDLTYSDVGLIYPTIPYSNLDLKYTADSTSTLAGYDNSLIYNAPQDISSSYILLGTKNISSTVGWGTIAPVQLWNEPASDPYYVSTPVRSGLNYKHYMGSYSSSVENGIALLQLVTDPTNAAAGDDSPSDSIAFRTKFKLTDNDCGPVLSLDLQPDGAVTSSVELKLQITLPDNLSLSLTNGTYSDQLNDGRNKIEVSLSGGGVARTPTDGMSFMDALPTLHRYYLQPKSTYAAESGAEYLHYQCMGCSGKGTPYYERGSVANGATNLANSYLDPVGNLLFITKEEDTANTSKQSCAFLSGVGNTEADDTINSYPDFYFNTTAATDGYIQGGAHGINMGTPRGADGYAYLPADIMTETKADNYLLDLYPDGNNGIVAPNSITPMIAYQRHPSSNLGTKSFFVVVTGKGLSKFTAFTTTYPETVSYTLTDNCGTYLFADTTNNCYLKVCIYKD